MRQREAISKLTDVLQQDAAVQAIFLKGSFGRGEGDEHSDIDLYVMVAPEEVADFLERRRQHLSAYRSILLEDEINIVAPQLIVVYDNFLHVDLFTVTSETLNVQDEIAVLFDPDNRLEHHPRSLILGDDDLYGHAFDTIWFFFQYTKARDRGNDIWAIEMLHQGMSHFAYVLAAHHEPTRSALGLKDVSARSRINLREWYESLTPTTHAEAARLYVARLEEEHPFLETIEGFAAVQPFFINLLQREKSRL